MSSSLFVISFCKFHLLDVILLSKTSLLKQVMQQKAIGRFLWVGIFQFCSVYVPLKQMLQQYRKNGEKHDLIYGLFQVV